MKYLLFMLLCLPASAQWLTINDPVFLAMARGSAYGGANVYGGSTNNLNQFYFVAYWSFDNSGALGADSVGMNTITFSGGSPSAVTGHVNGAMSTGFGVVGDVNDAAGLRLTNTSSFTIGGWFYVPSGTASKILFQKQMSLGLDQDYLLQFNSGTPNVSWTVDNNAGGSTTVTSGTVPNDTWFYIIAWYDNVGNTISIQLNNDTPVSSSFSGTPGGQGVPGVLQVGDGGGDNIVYDECFISSAVLSTVQKNLMYNGGAGNPLSNL